MKLSDLKVSEYILDQWQDLIDIRLELRIGFHGEKWAIMEKGTCLSKDGVWEYEPIPSSRNDEYLLRCRFDSPEQALEFWNHSGIKSRFEYYRNAAWRERR
jgi:hypothetical protein